MSTLQLEYILVLVIEIHEHYFWNIFQIVFPGN